MTCKRCGNYKIKALDIKQIKYTTYTKTYIVGFCPRCHSTFSDAISITTNITQTIIW